MSEGGGISRFRDFGHAHLPYLDRVFELQYLNTENCRPKKKKQMILVRVFIYWNV